MHEPIREQWLDLSVGRADLVEVPAEQLRQASSRATVVASPPVTLLALQVRIQARSRTEAARRRLRRPSIAARSPT